MDGTVEDPQSRYGTFRQVPTAVIKAPKLEGREKNLSEPVGGDPKLEGTP